MRIVQSLAIPVLLLLISGSGIAEVPSDDQETQVTKATELLKQIKSAGGRVAIHARPIFPRVQNQVRMVYIPRAALDSIRPTSLAVFPNLKGIMVIEPAKGDRPEVALTGCLIDRTSDLAKLENAYVDHGWMSKKPQADRIR